MAAHLERKGISGGLACKGGVHLGDGCTFCHFEIPLLNLGLWSHT